MLLDNLSQCQACLVETGVQQIGCFCDAVTIDWEVALYKPRIGQTFVVNRVETTDVVLSKNMNADFYEKIKEDEVLVYGEVLRETLQEILK